MTTCYFLPLGCSGRMQFLFWKFLLRQAGWAPLLERFLCSALPLWRMGQFFGLSYVAAERTICWKQGLWHFLVYGYGGLLSYEQSVVPLHLAVVRKKTDRKSIKTKKSCPWQDKRLGSRGDLPSKQGHSRSHSFRREKRDASPRQEHSRSRSRSPAWRKEDQLRQDPSNPRSRSRSPAWRKEDQTRHDPSNPGNNLYVTGLSTRVTEKDLERHLSREGKVLECRVVVDPRTRESRGFGFVTMDNLDDAERCIKYLNRSTLEGRMITIEKAKRKRARTPTPGEYLGIRAPVRSRPHRSGGYRRDGREGRDSRDSRDGHSSRRSPHYSPYRSRRDSRDRY